MNKNKKTARVSGLLYLVLAIIAFYIPYVNKKIVVLGDVSTTANNILESETLFRVGIMSNLLMNTTWIFLAISLYTLLKFVNKNIALLMVTLVLAGSAIMYITTLSSFTALEILTDSDYITAFGLEQIQALAMLSLEQYKYEIPISYLFFGLWLFPLGYLVFKSNIIPRILGILLVIAGFGYLTDFFTFFLIPHFDITITSYTFWGETLLLLWLLIKGVKFE
ncbi:MAG: DUF4386 domain-containing protein [Clostridiales bacterium]